MNGIREIVTKAVVAKGKKVIKVNANITDVEDVDSILGCLVINHRFSAALNEDKVNINGQFEVNIWYSSCERRETRISKEVIEYNEIVKTRQIIDDAIEDCRDVIVRVIQQPTCTDAVINDNSIDVCVIVEVIAEVIGETTMIINVYPKEEIKEEYVEDFENEINEDFLNCTD